MRLLAVALALTPLASCLCGVGDTQPQQCRDYANCAQRLGLTVDEARYGANGSCWETEPSTEQCETDCAGFNSTFKSTGQAQDAGCAFSN
jgi:hypothetical protein